MPYEDLPSGFGHWLAGFIDGEGCFYMRVLNRSQTSSEYVEMRFTLKVRDDDKPILDEIQARTGIGRVRGVRACGTSRPMSLWIVENKADRLALVSLLDHFPLRAKKSRDYAVWRESVLAYDALNIKPGNPGNKPPRDLAAFRELSDRMDEARAYVEVAA